MALKIVRNDITKMNTEAVVNTANQYPLVGRGCDEAIYNAAGFDDLLNYRKEYIGEVEEGNAFITPGFALEAKYIIHAVSPLFIDGNHHEETKLRACYQNSLKIALENHIHSIAFPLIATGSFLYPKEEGLRIAVDEINAFLIHHPMDVYLVVYDSKAIDFAINLDEELEEIRLEALEKLDSIKDKKQENVVKQINNLKKETHNVEVKKPETFELGDNVRIKDGEQIGTIIKIQGKRVDVNINGLIIKTELRYLKKMPKVKKTEVYVSKINTNIKAKKELNIVGKRVEEALVELESFLDEALLANLETVKIIHGIGSGQLRKAVRDKLKKLKFVKSFADGDYYDGA